MRPEPKTILVVDDEEDVRSLVAEFLTEEGWIVQTAADGRQALAVLDEMPDGEPALVVLDVMMPDMTGAEVLKTLAVSGRLPALPVIVLSADTEHAEGLGARRLLRKPASLALLLSAVNDACGGPADVLEGRDARGRSRR